MYRLSQVATLSSASLLPRQAVLAAQPRQHMRTVRANISRMLMSTNQSRIVDITHDKELKRGLKTNGEKSDYDESANKTVGEHVQDSTSVVTDAAKDAKNRLNNSAKRAAVRMEQDMGDAKDSAKSMGERAKKQAKDTADRASSVIDRTADKALNVAERADNKMQDMSQEAKKAMGEAKNSASELASREGDHSQTMQETSKQAMDGGQSTNKDDVKQSMKKVGNTTSRTGVSQADKENPDSIQRENAAGRMQGMSYNAADTAQGVSDRARGQLDSTQGQARAEDWDVAAKVMRESEASGGAAKDKGVDEQHIQPGTRNLRGTDDNFDNDPAVSIDDMQSKIRETKDKITGGADHVMESLGLSMRQTTQNVKEAVKGVTAPIRETVMGAATKAKEAVTGERESEKPDMDKGVVRTKKGDYPPGTKPEDIEKGKQGGPWQ